MKGKENGSEDILASTPLIKDMRIKKVAMLLVFLLLVTVIVSFYQAKTNQDINGAELEKQVEYLFHQTYPDYTLLSHTFFNQKESAYFLFTIKGANIPEQNPPLRFYGYLQITKSFDRYVVRNAQVFHCSPSERIPYDSNTLEDNIVFGLFLTPEVSKMELYQNNLLVATYLRKPENDFYFIPLPFPPSEIDRTVCYDQKNQLLNDSYPGASNISNP